MVRLVEVGDKTYMPVSYGSSEYDPLDPCWSETMGRKWTKWFAWYPVRVHGKLVWLKTVYFRTSKIRLLNGNGMKVGLEYGTIFDVLNDD